MPTHVCIYQVQINGEFSWPYQLPIRWLNFDVKWGHTMRKLVFLPSHIFSLFHFWQIDEFHVQPIHKKLIKSIMPQKIYIPVLLKYNLKLLKHMADDRQWFTLTSVPSKDSAWIMQADPSSMDLAEHGTVRFLK